jgi:hypothetical protein
MALTAIKSAVERAHTDTKRALTAPVLGNTVQTIGMALTAIKRALTAIKRALTAPVRGNTVQRIGMAMTAAETVHMLVNQQCASLSVPRHGTEPQASCGLMNSERSTATATIAMQITIAIGSFLTAAIAMQITLARCTILGKRCSFSPLRLPCR